MKILKCQRKTSQLNTEVTFKALLDATIPRTTESVEKKDEIQSLGAVDLNTYKYQIWALDHCFYISIFKINFRIQLSESTAKMLDIAARKLMDKGENEESINYSILQKEGEFSALTTSDRFRAIMLLKEFKVSLSSLPIPFWNNWRYVNSILDAMIMYNTIGYYSGWLEEHLTSMESYEKQKTESLPLSWRQVGYPGPSNGYHALRGYMFEKFTE